jgi:diguanylate cyclase (GGDEF)-like protein
MVMLDVVGLKAVNDDQGHLAGDALLQGVAVALREEAAGLGRAYRIGGDEFAIVLPGLDEADAARLLDDARVRVTVRHPRGIRGGVAAAGDAAELLSRASAALVDARRADGLSRVA